MKIYPNLYLKDVMQITKEILDKNKIKGLILDIDNTLIDFNKNIPQGVEEWCINLKKNEIKMCIVSNTNNLEKVKKVAEALDLEYIYFARKPFQQGFNKAKEMLKLKPEEIAVVGDQIFTDVLGGNVAKMFTILTEPLDKKDIFITKVKRPLEKLIIKRYLKGR